MPPEPVKFSGLRALVVEDEAIIAFLIEDMLAEAGFRETLHASTIAHALALLETASPDVAILDLNLAGEPSYAVAERLRAKGVPFVFASGYGTAGISNEWQGTPIVRKPFQANALMEALSTCLGATK